MEQARWTEILFKKISKITQRVLRIGPAMNNQIILEAELSQEFSNIVDVSQNLKINNRNQLGLCILLVMTTTLSSKLGFSSMLLTLLFVTASLVYDHFPAKYGTVHAEKPFPDLLQEFSIIFGQHTTSDRR